MEKLALASTAMIVASLFTLIVLLYKQGRRKAALVISKAVAGIASKLRT